MTSPTRASLFPGFAALAAVTGFAILLLWIEEQWEVMALAIGAVVALLLAGRFGLTGKAEASYRAHRGVMNLLSVAAVVVVAGFFHEDHFPLLMLATVLLYVTVCLGLTIQFGYSGVLNFAGAAFFGVGCYTAAVLTAHTPLPHLLVVVMGGAMASIIGSLLLLPVLRTHGHYAALVTIAFALLFKTFLEVNDTLGGPQGLKLPGMQVLGWNFNTNIEIGDWEFSFYLSYILVALALAVFAYALVKRLERSWIGLNLDAVRLDETAAASFGIDIARWKITAFTLGNFLAGMAGAVYAMMLGFIAPNNFNFGDSLILVSIVILGGIGNPLGIIPAAAIVVILPEKLQAIQEYRFLLFAAMVIAILLFRPEGLLPRRLRQYFPSWRPR